MPTKQTTTLPRPRIADAAPAASAAQREKLLADLPLTERRLDLAGITTSVLEGGQGAPLILLHGPGEFAGVWVRVIPELVATHRVIVPDLPGHGESGLPDSALDAARAVAWLGALVEATAASRATLVGHLLGGAIAARFASLHPDRVEGLVLVDAMGLGPFRPSLRFALAMAGFMARPNERSQERLFRGCFTDLDRVRDDLGSLWPPIARYALERARRPELQAALRRLMPAFALRTIPAEDLARLTMPVALIWGRHDLQVRLPIAEAANERFGWPLYVIEECGDDPAFEQPAAFLHALRDALAIQEKQP